MDPVLFTFHAPHHELDLVSRYVLRDRLADHLLLWRRITGACEMVYLATCQRALWILWGGDGENLGLAPDVTRYDGEAAWRHLLEVTTGLVSANLGDREIIEQLKDALENSKEAGVAGVEAQAALEDVLREAQRLRVRSGLADGSASVATASLRHLEEALPVGASIAVVGVGPMSRYLAQRLPERGFKVTVSNRTQSKAEALGLPTIPLEQLQHDPEGFDAIVTATAAPRPLFTLSAWERLKRPPLRILDLALPHDSEPALGQLSWVHRVDLASFLAETEQAKVARLEIAGKAEHLIVGAVGRLRKRAEERDHKYNTRTAQDRLADAWEALEGEALGGIFKDLDEERLEALRALLKRGRTLSYRALSQFHKQGHP